ncbi:hypothetical protein [Glutamicibacter sp. BW77]|uniref:hypothetical protein n=1 Tax=Glutamicibacter TaxID=1742989 RepID=UPI00114278EB|nr:hypothetical protein [Glutamicibacter sp. BW77]
MITADTITCRIPSETAIKLKELSCSVANPVSSADSQTWATWISAVATVVLAVFAIAAWRSSQAQIKHMKDESVKATERNHDQILASANLEHQRNLEESLFDYLGAHADIFAAGSGDQEALRLASVQLRKKSLRFIILRSLPGRSGEMTNLDDLAMMMAEAGTHTPHDGDLRYGRNELFNGVHNILRDFHEEKLPPEKLREEFRELFVRIMNGYDEYLDPEYVKLAENRGWLNE